MEKAKRSDDSISLNSSVPDSSVPEDLTVTPVIKRRKPSAKEAAEEACASMRQAVDNYQKTIMEQMDVNELLSVKRDEMIQKKIDELTTRVKAVEKICQHLWKNSQKPSPPTPASASTAGPAMPPPALKRCDAVASITVPTGAMPKKKVEIPTVGDDWTYCVKCNVDGHECS